MKLSKNRNNTNTKESIQHKHQENKIKREERYIIITLNMVFTAVIKEPRCIIPESID